MDIISESISYIVNAFGAIEESVLQVYIERAFDMTKNRAKLQIRNAIGRHICKSVKSKEGYDFVTTFFRNEVTGRDIRMSRAIRVALEFIKKGETDFFRDFTLIGREAPTLLRVILRPDEESLKRNGKLQAKTIEISYIMKNTEISTSNLLAQKPVAVSQRPYICRIGVVETGFCEEKLYRVGYELFIRFGANRFTFISDDILQPTVPADKRWADVPDLLDGTKKQ